MRPLGEPTVYGDIARANAGVGSLERRPPPPDHLFTWKVSSDELTLTTGDGKLIFPVDESLDGLTLLSAHASVSTVSSSGTPTVQLRRIRSGASNDMLTTAITIDVSEKFSYNAATPPLIDTSNDDVQRDDEISVDVDVAGTGTKGLAVIVVFGP